MENLNAIILVCLWWLSGFVPTMIWCGYKFGRIKIKDVFGGGVCSLGGPILWVFIFLEESDFIGEKVLWERKK